MIKLQFTQEMLELLKEMKNQEFISYDSEKSIAENTSFGYLRINLKDYSVDLINELQELPFFDTTEEIAGFSCRKINPQEFPFALFGFGETKTIPINEIIKSVEIISDEIKIESENYEIIFDSALIIKTENQTIMFYNNVWFMELIIIANNDDFDAIYPISSMIESWNNYGEWEVKIKRTRKLL